LLIKDLPEFDVEREMGIENDVQGMGTAYLSATCHPHSAQSSRKNGALRFHAVGHVPEW